MKFLLFILFLLFGFNAYCADINWCLDGTATGSVSSGATIGIPSYTKDNNTATSYGATGINYTFNTPGIYTATITFKEKAKKINKLELVLSSTIYTDSIYIKTSLVVNDILTDVYTFSDDSALSKSTITVAGPWNNVTSMTILFRVWARPSRSASGETWELRAFGPENIGNYIITFY
jgi:hypothetical protein